MERSHCKPKSKPKKQRYKTLCTLDTYDPNFTDSYLRKGKENDHRIRNCAYPTSLSKISTNKKTSMEHHKSQFSAYNCSRVRQNSNNKGKRAMSISHSSVNRVKTDYSQLQFNRTRGVGQSIKKKLVFPTEETYKFDCWQVLRTIWETSQSQILQVHQQANKRQKWVMVKTKNAVIKREFQKDSKTYRQLQKIIKNKERSIFLKVHKIFREKKDWMILTDNFYHADWSNDKHYLFISQLKNSHSQLQLVVRQIAKAIELLSRHGYAHSAISIQNIYFSINKGSLQLGQAIKLGGIGNSFMVSSKEAFLLMPTMFRTPPEILNFISFQCKQDFQRDYLQVIGRVEAGWMIDVWSLGVLILQILNGGPLSGEESQRQQLISLQKELPIRYSYLLSNIESRLRAMLVQMLSIDPWKRPHPRQILRLL